MNETSLNEILDILRRERSDNRQYEAKAAAKGFPQSIAKTICAFANMPGGGTIIMGVDERQDFAVTGVYDAKNCQHTLANYAQKEYTVPILIDISLLSVENKSIVLAIVHETKKSLKPIRYKKTNTSFIRQYDCDFELSELEEKLFKSNGGIVRHDEETIPNTSMADLNQNLTNGYIINRKRYSDVLATLDDTDVLVRTGVLHHSGELSVAGLLALGIYPQQHLPNYSIKASVRKTESTSPNIRAANVKSFDGPIPVMLESSLRWIISNSDEYTMDLAGGDVGRIGEYPLITCRELIANALIHRSLDPLSMIETISLVIEDDRLILSNPGGLFGISVRELGRTASRTRNARLAEICQYVPAERDTSIIEKLGSGIPKVYAEQDRLGFLRPWFIDGEIYFTAILRKGRPAARNNRLTAQTKNASLIMNALSGSALSRSEIEKQTSLTKSQVRYALSKLLDENRIEKLGGEKNPQNVYIIVDNN